MIFTKTIHIETEKPGDIINLTHKIEGAVGESKISNGIVHVFAPHATAVFALTELESNLREDIEKLLDNITPKEVWKHDVNAYSHLRSMLLPPDRTLPVRNGRVIKGTWQDLFFIEADTSGRLRKIEVTVIGE
ncbi:MULTISPECIES: secondary thiamine-phosphate synthase enzyme YjbQ [Methanobacterium]|uniref:Secondary thiamine-phosphate synthase enzyme YjbQ n=1 Tax=Methanobacterium veterum TaxID=408577 RepID=A0A9E5DKJ3_9EURY|nr:MULTISPECIES: secondary thiamine-phosphate synthase enzyme YjbQ [Methanobacterium]MCZ3367392.1 secondary thiamine-phosphate synthase enzyme YjbQ [Methanobacterium veterum]MCZ3373460.1 secondary thiamine-phosphate synthase enzyme YjbQ [Methanobacterium veterum]